MPTSVHSTVAHTAAYPAHPSCNYQVYIYRAKWVTINNCLTFWTTLAACLPHVHAATLLFAGRHSKEDYTLVLLVHHHQRQLGPVSDPQSCLQGTTETVSVQKRQQQYQYKHQFMFV
jgi:hypothetical protein